MDPRYYDASALNARADARYSVTHQPFVVEPTNFSSPNPGAGFFPHHHRGPQVAHPPPRTPQHDTRVYFPYLRHLEISNRNEIRVFDWDHRGSLRFESEIAGTAGVNRVRYDKDWVSEVELDRLLRRRLNEDKGIREFGSPKQWGIDQLDRENRSSLSNSKGKRKVLGSWAVRKSPRKENRSQEHSGVSVWDRIEEKLPPLPPRNVSPAQRFSASGNRLLDEKQQETDSLTLEYKSTGLVAKVVMPSRPAAVETKAPEIKQQVQVAEEAPKRKVVKKVLKKKKENVGPGSANKKIVEKTLSSGPLKVFSFSNASGNGSVDASSSKAVEDAAKQLSIREEASKAITRKTRVNKVVKAVSLVKKSKCEVAKNDAEAIVSKEGGSNGVSSEERRSVGLAKGGSNKVIKKVGKSVGSGRSGGSEVPSSKEGRTVVVKKVVQKSANANFSGNSGEQPKNSQLDQQAHVVDQNPTDKNALEDFNKNAVPQLMTTSEQTGQNVQGHILLDVMVDNKFSLGPCTGGACLTNGSVGSRTADRSSDAILPVVVTSNAQVSDAAECVERLLGYQAGIADSCLKESSLGLYANIQVTTTSTASTLCGEPHCLKDPDESSGEDKQHEIDAVLVEGETEAPDSEKFTSGDELLNSAGNDIRAAPSTLCGDTYYLEDVNIPEVNCGEEKQHEINDVLVEETEAPGNGFIESGDDLLHSTVNEKQVVVSPVVPTEDTSFASSQSRSLHEGVACGSLSTGLSMSDSLRSVENGLFGHTTNMLNKASENSLPSEISGSDSMNVTPMVQDMMYCADEEPVNLLLLDSDCCKDDNCKTIRKTTDHSKPPTLPQKFSASETDKDTAGKSMHNFQPPPEKKLPQEDSKRHITGISNSLGVATSSKPLINAGVSKFFPTRPSLVTSSKRVSPNIQTVRNKTWRRTDSSASASSLLVRQSPKKPKPPSSSYIRKGNSLIRKSSPIEVSTSQIPRGYLASSGVNNNNGLKHKSNNSDQINCSNPTFGTLKAPLVPLSNSIPMSSSKPIQDGSSSISEVPFCEFTTESQTVDPLGGNVDSMTASISRKSESSNMKMIYVKRKSNQLVAAHGNEPGDSSLSPIDKAQLPSSVNLPDMYYRKKNNQLVRNTLSSDVQQKQSAVIAANNASSADPKLSYVFPPGNGAAGICKKRLDKVMLKARKHSTFSIVWTLNGGSLNRKADAVSFRSNILPSLFPWKRAPCRKSLTSTSNNYPLNSISRKLQLTRKRNTIYKVSADGFSLRKAGVLSIGGANLKWSKSIEKRSKKASEEATIAVAEVERKKRQRKRSSASGASKKSGSLLVQKSASSVKLQRGERVFCIGSARYKMDASRRTLIRIPDDQSSFAEDQQLGSTCQKSFIPKRLLIDNQEYIRIGNGNKLVRDPKKLKRILASEKVRWSLHNVRSRMAKKQQFCQFFTRFGKCNKTEGKCPYIHDPSKVAICTKFLRGVCSNSDCKLTHKIIPERMPDCSFFLQGICTNTNCPYRHVKVNFKAPVCEGFLRGYCSDGDECCKKHTYVCPAFEATGKCLQGSTCRLHHPKRTKKIKKKKRTKIQDYNRGRYFGSNMMEVSRPLTAPSNDGHTENCGNGVFADDLLGDYISLDVGNCDFSDNPVEPAQMEEDSDIEDLEQDELDALIKPIKIMNTLNHTRSSSPSTH